MNQKSRETLIELLLLSIYLDQCVTEAEDDVLNAAIASIGWDSQETEDHFIATAYAASREAAACPIKTEQFLADRIDTIRTAHEEGRVLTWISRILAVDGLTRVEARFLSHLEKWLYPTD